MSQTQQNFRLQHVIFPILCLLILIGTIHIPYTSARGQAPVNLNLIQNPSNDFPLVAGEIPHWTEAVGNNWTQRSESPLPYHGSAYFFAGRGALAELQQDINVSAFAGAIDSSNQDFQFNGYVRAWPQSPADSSQIIIEYRDATNTVILDSFDSGEISDTDNWVLVTDLRTAPIDTRFIRIRLISTRYNGSNNDGYFDGLSLEPAGYDQQLFLPTIIR